MMVVVKPVVHGCGINPEGKLTTVNQRLVVLRPVGVGVKRRAHDADLKRMEVIRSPSPQLVPFKLHRFGQQRLSRGDQNFIIYNFSTDHLITIHFSSAYFHHLIHPFC